MPLSTEAVPFYIFASNPEKLITSSPFQQLLFLLASLLFLLIVTTLIEVK
jgi:hypothetical protein